MDSLDRQVAEAIGWAGGEPYPKYSTDLNAAWQAAERVFNQIYPNECRVALEKTNRGSFASITPREFQGEGATPALALCNAILAAKKH